MGNKIIMVMTAILGLTFSVGLSAMTPESKVHEIVNEGNSKLRCWFIESIDENGNYSIVERCEETPNAK